MATESGNPGVPEGSARTAEQKLDAVVAYVKRKELEEREAEKEFHWTDFFGKVGIYLALAAFFFGVGTFGDAKAWFEHATPAQQLSGTVYDLSLICTTQMPTSAANANSYSLIAADDRTVLGNRIVMDEEITADADEYYKSYADGTSIVWALVEAFTEGNDALIAAIDAADASNAAEYAQADAQYHDAQVEVAHAANALGADCIGHLNDAIAPPLTPAGTP